MSNDNFTYVKPVTRPEAIIKAIDTLEVITGRCDHNSPEPNATVCSNCSRYKFQLNDMYRLGVETGILERPNLTETYPIPE